MAVLALSSSPLLVRLPHKVGLSCGSSASLSPLFLTFPRRRSRSAIASASLAQDGDLSATTSTTTVRQSAIVEGDIISGEWPENFSILNYEDLCKHYEPMVFKEDAQPHSIIAEVMSKIQFTATPDQLLEEVDQYFLTVSGLPVVNKDFKCLGVLSKKDRKKASKGLQSTVGEVMTSPAISLSADKTVNDAAILMLKNKVHRIPIVNDANQVVGIVTRTDIFRALEGEA